MDAYERAATRRELLRLGLVASVAAVWLPRGLWGWAQDVLPATPNTTPGPFYPVIKPPDHDTDLIHVRGHRRRAQGQVILVAGRVLDQRGEPIHGARALSFGRPTLLVATTILQTRIRRLLIRTSRVTESNSPTGKADTGLRRSSLDRTPSTKRTSELLISTSK